MLNLFQVRLGKRFSQGPTGARIREKNKNKGEGGLFVLQEHNTGKYRYSCKKQSISILKSKTICIRINFRFCYALTIISNLLNCMFRHSVLIKGFFCEFNFLSFAIMNVNAVQAAAKLRIKNHTTDSIPIKYPPKHTKIKFLWNIFSKILFVLALKHHRFVRFAVLQQTPFCNFAILQQSTFRKRR